MIDKKSNTLLVATRLFAIQGYDNTSIAQICKEAAVSKGLIYHYFKSKNDILREIFSQETAKMINADSPFLQSTKPALHLMELINNIFTRLQTDKESFQFNLNIMFQPSTRKILDDLIKVRSKFLFESVKSIFDLIAPKQSTEYSYMFIAEIDGIALDFLSVYDHYPLESMKNLLLKKYSKL